MGAGDSVEILKERILEIEDKLRRAWRNDDDEDCAMLEGQLRRIAEKMKQEPTDNERKAD